MKHLLHEKRLGLSVLFLLLLLSLSLLMLSSCEGGSGEQGTEDVQSGTDAITDEHETEEEKMTLPPEYDDIRSEDGYFRVRYVTESYLGIGEEIDLSAEFVKNSGETAYCLFTSLDPDIAAVTQTGTVRGVSEGLAVIRACVNEQVYFDFTVTVLPGDVSPALLLAVRAHNSNIFVRPELGIGAGTPVYYRDIYGSVSGLLYNDPLVIDRTYEKAGTANTDHSDGPRAKHGFELEYITVHYTGNMDVNATAKNNAEYFAYTKEVSVHYVTGNDGVYACLDDSYVSWNAGDRASGSGPLTWKATGVYAKEGEEKLTPQFGVSANQKFTVNGEETSVNIPRRHGVTYNGDTFTYKGNEYPLFPQLGIPWKIVDGEYYLGKTWWCYRTTTAGCICGIGGDYNSISIESAVNPETDLWYTWHKTAQLVAKLLEDNGLDTTRVTGHHMWTQKDCPQPMLENDLEIWHEFLRMVECEYDALHAFPDCRYSMELLSGSEVCTDAGKRARLKYNGKWYNYTQNPGRVIPDGDPHIVVYRVSVETPSGTESVTLATAVNKAG